MTEFLFCSLGKFYFKNYRSKCFQKSSSHSYQTNPNQIEITIFLLILNQTEFRLVPNQSENGKYNLILVDLTRFNKIFSV